MVIGMDKKWMILTCFFSVLTFVSSVILSKSNKFYKNAFGTNVNYKSLMNFKKELMK